MSKKIDLVFLAGGKGTRIKKYLNGDPKPLVKINNISFIEILLRYYSRTSLVIFIFWQVIEVGK